MLRSFHGVSGAQEEEEKVSSRAGEAIRDASEKQHDWLTGLIDPLKGLIAVLSPFKQRLRGRLAIFAKRFGL